MTQQPTFPGFEPTALTEDDWLAKSIEIGDLFSPTAPVRETDLFSGRRHLMEKLVDGVLQAGQHVVVYGDRGVGKTSLVNATANKIFSVSRSRKFFLTQCFAEDDFIQIWERAFYNHKWEDGTYALDDVDASTGPFEILQLTERFKATNKPVFVFDEFDRVTDPDTRKRMAETIKLLSDQSTDATIVIVGVGRTVRDLLSEHESIKRALKQIEMPRMSEAEIREIITVRLPRVAMEIDDDALNLIVWLSRGMPGYAHLMGLYSAREAINRQSLSVNTQDLTSSLGECLEEAGESTRYGYLEATRSAHTNNLLGHALLACAIAHQDSFGAFKASDVREPYGRIVGRPVALPDYARHLKAFCGKERGPILEKDGTPKNFRYRFIDPMMQSYVIMKGLKDGLLPSTTSRR